MRAGSTETPLAAAISGMLTEVSTRRLYELPLYAG